MTSPRICVARPTDREAVARLLCELSPESAYRRFQTGLGPVPRRAVLDALLPDAPQGAAVLAYDGARLVGHGVWHRMRSGPAAEIALLVVDDHQAQGVGTALARALLDDLAREGIEQVEVFATATNRTVARMVAGVAPDAVPDRDGTTVTYTFPTPAPTSAHAARSVA